MDKWSERNLFLQVVFQRRSCPINHNQSLLERGLHLRRPPCPGVLYDMLNDYTSDPSPYERGQRGNRRKCMLEVVGLTYQMGRGATWERTV